MALKVNNKYLSSFIGEHEYAAIQPAVTAAHETLKAKNGPGNDFLGWVTLPRITTRKNSEESRLLPKKSRRTARS